MRIVNTLALVLVGFAILIGTLGIVVPILPGALLALLAIAVWAFELQTATGWVTLGIAAALIATSQVVKYTIPGRRLREAGLPRGSLFAGALLAIVGFFVVPVVGMFVGFPLGIYLAERRRLGERAAAWTSTKQALHATGLSILIELAGTMLAAGAWLVAVLFVAGGR